MGILQDMIAWSISPYSICYIFNKDNNVNNESRIAFVTVSDLTAYPHPKSWHPLARMNRLLYSQFFGYDYCDFPRDWDFTTLRESRWEKFGALHTVLTYYQYAVWLDTDTLFWNKERIPLHRHILPYYANYSNLSVIFSDHGRHSSLINAGIFILKHNKFSFDFLERSYSDYVNADVTQNHADQDAFQAFVDEHNENGEVMVIPSWFLQRIYVQMNPHKFSDDYKKLNEKQGESIIFHRVGGGKKKYFQMNDVIMDWMDSKILNRMKMQCPHCFKKNKNWNDAVKGVNMKQFENQKGNKLLRLAEKKEINKTNFE